MVLIRVLLGALAIFAAFATIAKLQRRARERRRREGTGAGIPARLRGIDRAYPGYWRPGWFDQRTRQWRPRTQWGIPLSLVRGRVIGVGGGKGQGLPQAVSADTVLTCSDAAGNPFQMAVEGSRYAATIKRRFK